MTNLQLPDGFKAEAIHNRLMQASGKMDQLRCVSPMGGSTVVKLYNEDESVVVYGVADCNPKDHFNRKLGYRIALGRALKKINGSGGA